MQKTFIKNLALLLTLNLLIKPFWVFGIEREVQAVTMGDMAIVSSLAASDFTQVLSALRFVAPSREKLFFTIRARTIDVKNLTSLFTSETTHGSAPTVLFYCVTKYGKSPIHQ